MKCDELKAEQWLDYSGEPMPCYPKEKVDEAVANTTVSAIKRRNERLTNVKEVDAGQKPVELRGWQHDLQRRIRS